MMKPFRDSIAVQKGAGSRRRSSVPFADRQAKVRFNRIETMITSTKPGPHKPIIPGTSSEEDILKIVHSILKETQHPILIDLTLLSFERPTTERKTLSNDEMLLCITMVEWQSKAVAKADRHGRGAIDILSFPTAGDRVDAGSRMKGTLMVTADLMNRLTGEIDLNDPENKTHLEKISKTMTKFVTAAVDICETAKIFLQRTTTLFHKWRDLLRKKGEFHLEHVKITAALYGLTQPESCTLYEDHTPNPDDYEGSLIFFWNTTTMTICSDGDSNVRNILNFTQVEKLTILAMLIEHGTELIKSSDQQFQETLEVFQEPILQTGFDNIRSRVIGMRFDARSDPLMVLDLKNTLSELVQRNCELLNCAEKSLEVVDAILKTIQLLDRFTRQFLQGVKLKKKKCRCCGFCCRSRDVRFEDLGSILGRVQISDILMYVPQPTSYKIPDQDDVSIKDMDGDDKETESVNSATSTIYRLIQNSDAELRLLL